KLICLLIDFFKIIEPICRNIDSDWLQYLSGQQLYIFSICLINPCCLIVFCKVKKSKDLIPVIVSSDAKDPGVPGLDGPGVCIGHKCLFTFANLLQLLKPLIYLAF